MSSRCPERIGLALAAAAFVFSSSVSYARVLRVCADPNNLPFSNHSGEGFENKMAELLARDLEAKLEYTWWSERKSFIKNSLNSGRCDVVLGIATGVDSVLATTPYYRSSYVFVSRADRNLHVSSLADERLAKWRIGVHVVGDDYAPPAHALATRGLAANLVGFSLFGALEEQNPAAKIIESVRNGHVDVAIVWGPLAGYFATLGKERLEVSPVSPPMWMGVPFTYDIAMGVRQNDETLKAELDQVLRNECEVVRNLLTRYGIPMIAEEQPTCDGSRQQASASSR